MRIASRLGAVLVAGLVAGCATFPQAPPALPATYIPEVGATAAPMRPLSGFTSAESVAVRLRVEKCRQFTNGSGWVLNDNTVVTNRHVVEGAVRIELTSHDGIDYTTTGSVVADFADLALVTVEGEFPRAAVIAQEEPQQGDILSIVGYPEGNRLQTDQGAYGGELDDTLFDGSDRVYYIDSPTKPGNSGSPVVNEDDEVVGVLYAGNSNDASYAVTLPSLQTFLEDDSTHRTADADC